MDCEIARWVVNKEIIPLYIETAKTFMNVSAAALGGIIVFREKIVGQAPGSRVPWPLSLCWFGYLLTIALSAFYQYLAVKFLDSVSCAPGRIEMFESLVRSPGLVYGAMLVLFVLASSLLVLAAWRQLPRTAG